MVLSSVGSEAATTLLDLEGEEALAYQILKEANRAVQSRGWNFNRDYGQVHSPSVVDNTVRVSESVIQADQVESEFLNTDVVLRGDQLYDRKNHTYEFTADIKLDLITMLDWDKLPEPARHYIAVLAARVFNQRVLGEKAYQSATLTMRDEEAALADLKHWDSDSADHNALFNTFGQGIANPRGLPSHLRI